MKTICFTLPTIDQVEFKVASHEEDIPIRGNAIASGDNEFDTKVENDLIEQLQNGNIWAWCTIEVIAKFKGYEGNDYLGCCSYKSEKDFVEAGDYYVDMKQRAYDELISQLEELEETI